MKLKCDENLPLESAEVFREAGFDCTNVVGQSLSGVTDAVLFSTVQLEGRILVTLYLDFSDIRTYPPEDHAGVIVLRPKSHDIPSILSLIRRISILLGKQSIEHRLWIVDDKRSRIRE
jgi:predicted nuclease of predicted toxin-antitoxin system